MAAITVPTKRTPPPRVPAAGAYSGTLTKLAEREDKSFLVAWRFSAPHAHTGVKGQFTLERAMTPVEFGDMLHDIGMAGQQIDPAKLPGKLKAQVSITTFGRRTSARVTGFAPLPK